MVAKSSEDGSQNLHEEVELRYRTNLHRYFKYGRASTTVTKEDWHAINGNTLNAVLAMKEMLTCQSMARASLDPVYKRPWRLPVPPSPICLPPLFGSRHFYFPSTEPLCLLWEGLAHVKKQQGNARRRRGELAIYHSSPFPSRHLNLPTVAVFSQKAQFHKVSSCFRHKGVSSRPGFPEPLLSIPLNNATPLQIFPSHLLEYSIFSYLIFKEFYHK